MSLIVLYFLHSTSVLSFYIDVVLTLLLECCHSHFMSDSHDIYPLSNLTKLESNGIILNAKFVFKSVSTHDLAIFALIHINS